jgi:hypothetical protein
MNTTLDTLAREKEILLLRSTLGRLKLRYAAQELRDSRVVVLASRIAFFAKLARVVIYGRIRQRADARLGPR